MLRRPDRLRSDLYDNELTVAINSAAKLTIEQLRPCLDDADKGPPTLENIEAG